MEGKNTFRKNRKIYGKKLSCVGTALVLTVFMFFSGCGRKEDNRLQMEPETASEKTEFAWEADVTDLHLKLDAVSDICRNNGNLYMIASKSVEEKESYDQKYVLVSCKEDGSGVQTTELALKKEEYPGGMMVDSQNRLQLLLKENTGENGERTKFTLKMIKEDGTLQEICTLKGKEVRKRNFYTSDHVIAEDGSLYLTGETRIFVFAPDGKQKEIIDFQRELGGIFRAEDGSIYVYGDRTDRIGTVIRKIDTKTGELSEEITWENYRMFNFDMLDGGSGIVYIGDESRVYAFDMESGELEILFSYLNCAMNGNYVEGILPDGEDGFLAVYMEEDAPALVRIRKEKVSGKECKVLRFACVYLQEEMTEHVLAFNREHKNYKIEVKEYSGYEDSAQQLQLDMASGEVPDILALEQLPGEMYAKKGLLADLYPLMEGDTEVCREDLIDTVREALEWEGKLYYLPPTFCVWGLAGGTDILEKVVGDSEGWDMEEMQTLYQKMPEDGVFLYRTSREDFLADIVRMQMEQYVDWETGEVTFDSESFIRLIEFSKQMPVFEEMERSLSELELVKKRNLMLTDFGLSEISDMQSASRLFRSCSGVRIMSYPSEDKNTLLSMECSTSALAIMDSSEEKAAAWEFVRQFFQYDYQIKGGNDVFSSLVGIPVRRDAFEKKLEYAMAEESYTLEDGTEIEPHFEYGALTAEEAEQIRSIVSRIGMVRARYDSVSEKIVEIVSEEAEAYYAGDKTAEETAGIIKNRVKIFVSENS